MTSMTALTAAAARAAHLIVDGPPPIFVDPLASTLLGERADELIDYHRRHGDHPVLAGARAQVTCRSRYTEDRLAASGATQYVILGAGLDSFAYRSSGAVRVFEVDHPATQDWKRERLAAAGIAAAATFVPVDFERDPLADRLTDAGLDPSRPALVSWLGVTMYLSDDAIAATLAAIGRLAPGSELVVDYMLPAQLRDEAGQVYVDLVAPVAAQHGEPWLTFFSPYQMRERLKAHGFAPVEDVGQRDAIGAAPWDRTDALRPAELSHLARALLSSPP